MLAFQLVSLITSAMQVCCTAIKSPPMVSFEWCRKNHVDKDHMDKNHMDKNQCFESEVKPMKEIFQN